MKGENSASPAEAGKQEMMVSDLQHLIRPAPALALDDSAARAVRLLRARALPALPVVEGGRLVGMVLEADLLHVAAGAADRREAMRGTRVGQVMRPAQHTTGQQDSVDGLVRALDESGAPMVAVTSPDGQYLGGVLLRRDVLAAVAGQPPVPPVAGLATPFGVHLTTGALRAGANDLALAGTGAALMVMNLLAGGVVFGLAKAAQNLGSSSSSGLAAEAPSYLVFALTAAFYAVQVAVFLLLLRFSPLSRIHGAEHMVVHAIEEGEDLALPKVKAMSRVHPRCGTNLMALLILAVIAQQFLTSLNTRLNDATRTLVLFVLVMIVLITWRRLGAGLQRWVTTREPSERQLAGAIAVGSALLEKIRVQPRARASARRRIWNLGFVQVMTGFVAVAAAVEYGHPLLGMAWAWLRR